MLEKNSVYGINKRNNYWHMKQKVVLLDSIRSMQNVGAIFRNADGAWFQKLFLCWHSPTPPRGDISKTALWAEKTIDWEYFSDAKKALEVLKKDWFKIFALETWENVRDFREFYSEKFEKVCIILWNEVSWVNKELLTLCDDIVMIPMLGEKSSLNVSVAAWIIMYTFI